MASMTGRKGTGRTFAALLACTALTLVLAPGGVRAGSLTPPAAPTDAGSAMYTLEQIYQRLDNGAAGAKRAGAFVEPTDLGATMHTLDQIMGIAPALNNTTGAVPGDVCNGKTFWGLRSEPNWGPVTGNGPCSPLFTQTFGPFTVAEDATSGTSVGSPVTAYSTGTPSYSIQAGNTGGVFAINSSSGQITRSGSGTIDYETARSYLLTIRATQATVTRDLLVSVNVTNVDDNNPTLTGAGTSTGPFSVAEDAASGTVVGRVVAVDADGDALTYSITAGNTGSVFAIGSSSGQITRSGSGTIDYETTASYSLTVEAGDGSAPPASATVTVFVTNADDNTPVISPTNPSFSVQENAAVGTRVGAVTATDADGDDLTYSITAGNTGGAFAIDSASGQITVAVSPDRETTSSYSLTVRVSDGSHNTNTTVDITVIDVNEDPVVATNTGISVSQDGTEVINASELSVTDVDSTNSQLRIIVTALPTHGVLQFNTGGGTWVNLAAPGRSFFTMTDVGGNDVRYDHTGTDGTDDSFTFTVIDSEGGTIGATTFSITVN